MFVRTAALFIVTALAEVAGCYLPFLWLRHGRTPLVLLPAAIALAAFVWLLTLHPLEFGAGRVYAAYGGIYVAVALGWMWLVEGLRPSTWDIIGTGVSITGMAIIVLAPRQ